MGEIKRKGNGSCETKREIKVAFILHRKIDFFYHAHNIQDTNINKYVPEENEKWNNIKMTEYAFSYQEHSF